MYKVSPEQASVAHLSAPVAKDDKCPAFKRLFHTSDRDLFRDCL